MAWVSTGFVRQVAPSWGAVLHGVACLVFGLQFVGLAMAIRWLRDWPLPLAALVCSGVAVAGELVESRIGITWVVSNLSLTVVDTPLAQYSALATPFGISGILYLVNFLSVRVESERFAIRWGGPLAAAGLTVCAWWGGCLLASTTSVEPLPFSVMLVQPHARVSPESAYRPWNPLDKLTREDLQSGGAVDLIVWPETVLSDSRLEDQGTGPSDPATQMTLTEFRRELQPEYRTPCLVGAALWKSRTGKRYGLEVTELRRFNCACLVSADAEVANHEKLVLVPFKEALPEWLNETPLRHWILSRLQLNAPLTPGTTTPVLEFLTGDGRIKRVAVAICYESFFPWLPQYRHSHDMDAIIHLVNDGSTADHPEVIERQIRACRLRAIETRKWNLVCSNWSGSAVIDPAGRVHRQLPAVSGVLRFGGIDH